MEDNYIVILIDGEPFSHILDANSVLDYPAELQRDPWSPELNALSRMLPVWVLAQALPGGSNNAWFQFMPLAAFGPDSFYEESANLCLPNERSN